MSDKTAQETACIRLLIIPNMARKTLNVSLLACQNTAHFTVSHLC